MKLELWRCLKIFVGFDEFPCEFVRIFSVPLCFPPKVEDDGKTRGEW
ncbi:MAG: hypothetical protein QXN96_03820 [Candidatus Bathyarchaeia archaeon]